MSETIWQRAETRSTSRRWRPSLKQLFVFTIVILLAGLGILFLLIYNGSQRSIMESSTALREQTSRDIAVRIEAHLGKAEDVVRDLEDQFQSGLLTHSDRQGIEKALFVRLVHESELSEITLTCAQLEGHASDGSPQFSKEGRWQASYLRENKTLSSRRLSLENGSFVLEARQLVGPHPFGVAYGRVNARPVADPTAHATFQTPARADLAGMPLWSDLHWSELDAESAPTQRRVVISLQKSMNDAFGKFVGVIRVGLLADQLDAITRLTLTGGENDPHRVLLCDRQGRLVSRWNPADGFEEDGDDLRARAANLPPELSAALHREELSRTDVLSSARYEIAGETYLATYRSLDRSQDWIVAIVVPESVYLQHLNTARNRLLAASLLLMIVIVIGGLWTIRVVRRDLGLALRETQRISDFDFAPARAVAHITDIDAILTGVERSKTAMRAMQKYVPALVVRQLHEANAEPVLGSELRELTLMFTDLKDFTAISESMSPNELAHILGDYLAVMTQAIHSTHGTVDKFIGDAVMAFWNAPLSHAEHSRKACEAALRCVETTRALFASPQWANRPILQTRFGIHRAEVLVGHFGAPDRLNYTAIGDGVNAAARLEGLNKEYGTSVLVSESVYTQVRDHFRFRLLDAVAVKGKSLSLRVYELLGRTGDLLQNASEIENYEQAFELYQRRQFSDALTLLHNNKSDAPSRVLAMRCKAFLIDAPEDKWNGVFFASTK